MQNRLPGAVSGACALTHSIRNGRSAAPSLKRHTHHTSPRIVASDNVNDAHVNKFRIRHCVCSPCHLGLRLDAENCAWLAVTFCCTGAAVEQPASTAISRDERAAVQTFSEA